MDNDTTLYDPNQLPDAVLVDKYHPHGDAFTTNLRNIQRAIVTASSKMRPKHVEVVKLYHTGIHKSLTKIADHSKLHPSTVRKIVQSPDGLALLTLLRHYAAALEGPRVSQRKHILWRIAVDNEEDNPRIAIAAVAELNRMDMVQHQIESTPNPNGPAPMVNITINQDQLPRTTLDG